MTVSILSIISSAFFIASVFRFGGDKAIQLIVFLLILTAFIQVFRNYYIQIDKKIFYLVIMYVIVASLGIVNSPEKSITRNEIYILLFSISFAVLFSGLKQNYQDIFLKIPVIIALWYSIILISFFVSNPIKYFYVDIIPQQFILNYNLVSGYLILTLPLSLIYSRLNNKINSTLFVIIFIGILLTKSRIAIFSGSIVLLYQLYEIKTSKVFLTTFFSGILILLGVITYLKTNNSHTTDLNLMHDRIVWWQAAFACFKNHFFIGNGLGSFENLYLNFKSQAANNTVYVHNFALEILLETGLLGLLILSAIIFFALRNINPGSRNSTGLLHWSFNNLSAAKKIIILSTACYFVNELFSYTFNYLPFTILTFSYIFYLSGQDSETTKLDKPRFSIFTGFLIITLMITPFTMIVIGQIFRNQGLFYLQANKLELADVMFTKSIVFDPLPSDIYANTAELNFKFYQQTKNISYLNKAIQFQESALFRSKTNATRYSDLAWLYRVKGNIPKAKSLIKEAAVLDRFNKNYSDEEN